MSPDSKRFADEISSEYFKALQDQDPGKSPSKKAGDLADAQLLGRVMAEMRSFMTGYPNGLADRFTEEQARAAGRKPKRLRGFLRFFRR